jgi:hypothetical protein
MATAIVESGSYDLLIDTGFIVDGFTLDNTTKGVLNNFKVIHLRFGDNYLHNDIFDENVKEYDDHAARRIRLRASVFFSTRT